MPRMLSSATALVAALSLSLPMPLLSQETPAQPELCPDGTEPPCMDAAPPEVAPPAEPAGVAEPATPAEEPAPPPPDATPRAAEPTAPPLEAAPPAAEPEAEPEAPAEAAPETTPLAAPEPEAPAQPEPPIATQTPEAAQPTDPASEAAPPEPVPPGDTPTMPGQAPDALPAPAEEAAEPAAEQPSDAGEQPSDAGAEAVAPPARQTQPGATQEPAGQGDAAESQTEPAGEPVEAAREPGAGESDSAQAQQVLEEAEAARQAATTAAGAAAAGAPADAAAEVTEETVTAETARSSAENFASQLRQSDRDDDASDDDDDDRDMLMGTVLGALGGFAVAQILNNRQVVAAADDRVVVQRDNGAYQLIKDDDALLRQPGARVRTETFADGSTRTTVEREDGSQVVTIRDAELRVVRRTRILPDGREIRLIDDLAVQTPIDVSRLPRPSASREGLSDAEALRRALEAAERPGRSYSLAQVREIQAVRALAPAIELDSITFDTGSAAIRPEQAQALSDLGHELAQLIADNPGEVFLVEGHTDAVGDAAMNLALSDRRAESVALALSEYFDVPPENLVVQGYGERYLRIQTDAAERQNRRAAVRRITDLLQVAASSAAN